jgi:hypothetical protein
MKGRTFIALVLVFSLVAPVGAAVVGAQDGSTNSSDDGDESYTLDELRQDGPTYSNSPPSVRMTDSRMYWLVHWPASNPTADPGEDNNWVHLGKDGGVVERNAVWLRTILFDDSETHTLKIVYWTEGERTVQKGNQTVTEPAATNVTVDEHKVTMSRGWPMQKVPLKQHDQPVRVTMWLEEYPETARWTFEHQSVATTQSAGISSEGDYLTRVSLEFLIPIVIGTFLVGYILKRALDKAGIGPQWGYAPWLILLTLITGAGVMWFYSSLADLIVMAPIVLAGYVVGIIGVIILETYTNNVSKALFIRPSLDYAKAPDGDDAFDMTEADIEEHQLVRMSDGGMAVVKKGLLPFLSRAFGGAARLENADQMKMRVKMPNSKWDEMFYVHPLAEEIVDYKPEGWSFDLPNPETAGDYINVAATGGLVLAGAYIVSLTVGQTIAAGATLLAVCAYAATPEDGHARVEPAPAHMRSAHATMMTLTEEYEDAETIDKAREELQKERISTEKQVEERLEDYDETLIQEMTGTTASPTIEGDGTEATADETEMEEVEGDD